MGDERQYRAALEHTLGQDDEDEDLEKRCEQSRARATLPKGVVSEVFDDRSSMAGSIRIGRHPTPQALQAWALGASGWIPLGH